MKLLHLPITLHMICSVWHFWMPNAAHSSPTGAKVKFAPRSLKSLAGTPNTTTNLSYSTFATIFAIWSLVMTGIACIVVGNHQQFLMLGGQLSSLVDSTLKKSTQMSFSGVCALMGHRGALGTAPSKEQYCWQPNTRALQSSTIMGH